MDNKGLIIDVLDMDDPNVSAMVELEVKGKSKIVKIYGMSNGVEVMIDEVIKAAGGKTGGIQALRFWGHGYFGGGTQFVVGHALGDKHRSSLSLDTLKALGARVQRLKPYFAQGGRVELRGCEVAQGKGKDLMLELATQWKVNVHASLKAQDLIITWKQPVIQATPDGGFNPVTPVELR